MKIPYKVNKAEMDGRTLQVKSLEDNYIMIDLKGLLPDRVDAIIRLNVIK